MIKKQSFIIGAFILAVGGILAKVVGAIYKIPLTHILGSNGMGVYYLIFPFYSLMIVLASGGISIAVTKLVAEQRSKRNKKNEMKIFVAGLIITFIISFVLSLLTSILSESLSLFQGNINATWGYFAIAPAIVSASLISIVKSYFQGVENMMPTSCTIIFEQIIKLLCGLFFAYKFLNLGIEYAVLGAVLGVTISEILGLIFISVYYYIYKKKQHYLFLFDNKNNKCKKYFCLTNIIKNKKQYKYTNVLKGTFNEFKNEEFLTYKYAFGVILKYALPATISSLIIPLTSFIDSFIVINLLINTGFSSTIATSLYGISNGVVASLISLPVILINAISTSIVPNLSNSAIVDAQSGVEFRSNFYIKLSFLLALPMFMIALVMAPEIISFLFSGGLSDKALLEFDFAYKLLMVSSVSIIYYAFLQTFSAILQAINKPAIPFISLFIALGFRTGLTFLLVSIKSINVFGVVIANIVFLAIASLICVIYINKYINLNLNIRKFLILPTFSVLLCGVSAYFTKLLLYNYLPVWLNLAISSLIGIVIYFVFIYIFKIFSAKEMEFFPYRKSIFKFQLKGNV